MLTRKILMTLLSLIVISTAVADKGKEHGGGSFIEIDGETQLSDAYYNSPGVEFKFQAFPEEIKTYMETVKHLMLRLGIDTGSFFEEKVYGLKAEYVLVNEEDADCPKYVTELTQDFTTHYQFGCTVGGLTYLFKEKFENAPIRVQAQAILHERLWAQNGNVAKRYIGRFTTIINRLLQVRDKQLIHGETPMLSSKEIEFLNKLFDASFQLGFELSSWVADHKSYQYKVSFTKAGGLIEKSRCIGTPMEKAYIGVGSMVSDCPEKMDSTPTNTKILYSIISGKSHLTASSTIIKSTITGFILGEHVNITDSYLTGFKQTYNLDDLHPALTDIKVTIGDNTVITNSTIMVPRDQRLAGFPFTSERYMVNSDTTILDSSLTGYFTIGKKSTIRNSELDNTKLGEAAMIVDSTIIRTHLGENAQIELSTVLRSRIDRNSTISDSNLRAMMMGDGFQCSNSTTAKFPRIDGGDQVTIENSKLSFTGNQARSKAIFGDGSTVKNVTLNIKPRGYEYDYSRTTKEFQITLGTDTTLQNITNGTIATSSKLSNDKGKQKWAKLTIEDGVKANFHGSLCGSKTELLIGRNNKIEITAETDLDKLQERRCKARK